MCKTKKVKLDEILTEGIQNIIVALHELDMTEEQTAAVVRQDEPLVWSNNNHALPVEFDELDNRYEYIRHWCKIFSHLSNMQRKGRGERL